MRRAEFARALQAAMTVTSPEPFERKSLCLPRKKLIPGSAKISQTTTVVPLHGSPAMSATDMKPMMRPVQCVLALAVGMFVQSTMLTFLPS